MWILDGRDAFANSAFEELRRYVEIFPSRCVTSSWLESSLAN